MSTLTKEFLESIGISLDDATFVAFSDHFDQTLQDRIYSDIIDGLDEEQILQLHNLKDSPGDEVWRWIQNNVTDLKEIIQEEVDILLGDLVENSDQISEPTS